MAPPIPSSKDNNGNDDESTISTSTSTSTMSSHTWTSSAAAKTSEFSRIQNNAHHSGLVGSPFLPTTPAEYAQHQAEFKHQRALEEREKLRWKIAMAEAKRGGVPVVGELMLGLGVRGRQVKVAKSGGGAGKGKERENQDGSVEDGFCKNENKKSYQVGYSKVLGLRTGVWVGHEQELTEGKRKHNRDQPRAYWPDASELRVEGSGRIDAGLPRRLPRPRIDAFNEKVLLYYLGDEEMTVEEMKKRVRQLTKCTAEEMVPWERETVDFQEALDSLESIDKERKEDDMLVGALGIDTIAKHGSLAAAVNAQAQIHGLSKKGRMMGEDGAGGKNYTSKAGTMLIGPKKMGGRDVGPFTDTATSNNLDRTRPAAVTPGSGIAVNDHSIPKTLGKNDVSSICSGIAPPSQAGRKPNSRNHRHTAIFYSGEDNGTRTTQSTAGSRPHSLNPAQYYNHCSNFAPGGNALSSIPAPFDPSRFYNVTAHLAPNGYASGNGFTRYPTRSTTSSNGLAHAAASMVYPDDKAYGADGNGDGRAPPKKGWAFDENYLRERGWGDLLDELNKGARGNAGPRTRK